MEDNEQSNGEPDIFQKMTTILNRMITFLSSAEAPDLGSDLSPDDNIEESEPSEDSGKSSCETDSSTEDEPMSSAHSSCHEDSISSESFDAEDEEKSSAPAHSTGEDAETIPDTDNEESDQDSDATILVEVLSPESPKKESSEEDRKPNDEDSDDWALTDSSDEEDSISSASQKRNRKIKGESFKRRKSRNHCTHPGNCLDDYLYGNLNSEDNEAATLFFALPWDTLPYLSNERCHKIFHLMHDLIDATNNLYKDPFWWDWIELSNEKWKQLTSPSKLRSTRMRAEQRRKAALAKRYRMSRHLATLKTAKHNE